MLEKEEASGRIFGLDLMRAIAILIVMYMHSMFVLPVSVQRIFNLPLPAMDGVSVFFVLSGFLIGGILLRILEEQNFGPREIFQFWIRRWFRTLPNYVLILTLVLVLCYALGRSTDEFTWTYYIFSQNLVVPHPEFFFPEAWSLSVEEWFYLLLPVLIFACSFLFKERKNAVLFVAITILVLPLVLRMQQYYLDPEDKKLPEMLRKIVIYRLDSLMYGVIMAYLFRYKKEFCIKYKDWGLGLSLAIVFMMTVNMRFLSNGIYYRAVWQPSFEPLAGMLALPFLASWRSTRWKYLGMPVRFVSTVSYSMYLLNLTLVQLILLPILTGEMSRALDQQPPLGIAFVRFGLFWAITFVLSWVLFRYFERPMRDLRDRFPLNAREKVPHRKQ